MYKRQDMDGVTSVYISKAMLSLMPDMKTEGVNIGEVASKLDNIQILSCEKTDLIAKLKKETAFISPKTVSYTHLASACSMRCSYFAFNSIMIGLSLIHI